MKLIARTFNDDGSGQVTLKPEEAEDMWHLYHLIASDDQIMATTIRKVQKESGSGLVNTERIKLTLTIAVDKVNFDPIAGSLRVAGKNVTDNKFIKLGQYHTLELEVQRKVTIIKSHWDPIFLHRLEEATDLTKSAEVAALLLGECGTSRILLMTQSMTVERQRLEVTIPKKRDAEAHGKGLVKFFDLTAQALLKHCNFEVLKCVIIASPGFVKDQFLNHLYKYAQTNEHKEVMQNKDKFITVHVNSPHKHALKEVLAEPSIAKKLEDTKAAGEIKALREFYDMLNQDMNRAWYGPQHIAYAAQNNAIEVLLVTDELFRAADVAKRKMYCDLCESVKECGGSVKIFSSLHPSGEQLQKISGVAAILRFPLHVPDDEKLDEASDDDSSSDSDSDDE